MNFSVMKFRPNTKKGQGAVEFALVLPVLLLLVLGLIETGRLIFYYSAVTNAAREAARYGSATGINERGNFRFEDCEEIINTAVQVGFLGSVQPENVNVTYDSGPGTPVLGGCPSNTDGNTTQPPNTQVQTGTRIVVRIESPFDTMIPGLLPFEDMAIRSESSRTIIRSVNILSTGVVNKPPATFTPTLTPSFTPTVTFTPTSTFTPSQTPTFTLTPVESYTPSRTPTLTLTSSLTPTPTFTATYTPTLTPTYTPQCSISADSVMQGRVGNNSNFTLVFRLSQPPVQYYLNTLRISTREQTNIQKLTLNGFEYASGTYPTNSDIQLTLRYIPVQSGVNTLYIEYTGNLGKSDHTNGAVVTLWNVAGITQCDRVVWP